METTPSSVRKNSHSSSSVSYKSKPQDLPKPDRSALIDITNDSPITGLATQLRSSSKPVSDPKSAPGSESGEALLRGQVKNLLRQVEQGNRIPVFARNPIPGLRAKLGFARSPMQILAPTPNNTPQLAPLVSDLGFLQPPPQIVSPIVPQSEPLMGPCLINRALQFDDSPDKLDASSAKTSQKSLEASSAKSCLELSLDASSEISSSSSLSLQESTGSVSLTFTKSRFGSPICSDESSEWSVKANAGTEGDSEGSDLGFEIKRNFEGLDEICEDSEGSNGFKIKRNFEGFEGLDEICEGMEKMKVEFEGKHVRFVYDSEGEEIVGCIENRAEPVREGKHLRFQEEEE